MTSAHMKAFVDAIKAADIKSYSITTAVTSHLYHDGERNLIAVDYNKEAVYNFRPSIGHSFPQFEGKIQVVTASFMEAHEARVAGSYDQIKKFVDSLGLQLNKDDFKVLINIDKANSDIKPITGDYTSGFHYLSKKQYEALPDEEKAKYDADLKEYEDSRRNYLGQNMAAQINL